jgi:hypothetical protein
MEKGGEREEGEIGRGGWLVGGGWVWEVDKKMRRVGPVWMKEKYEGRWMREKWI